MATPYPMQNGHGRGKLRVYLGAAPGVGKTYAMLAEGQRRRARSTDVVGALIETHGRTLTEEMAEGIARRADQIELVDMTPEALRRRMVHGNIYPPNRIDAALTHYFRPGNLTALRELALLWVADRVEEGMQQYRAEHGIAALWETRERIIVSIAGEKGDEAVIRRAARIAARGRRRTDEFARLRSG